MKKIKYLLSFLLVLLGTSCTSKKPIVIGVNSWPPCELWYVAEELGYFGNTNIEIVRFSSWGDNMASLYTGQTDITHSTYFNSLFYQDKGEEGNIFLISDTIKGGDGFTVKNKYNSIKELKGKKIAVEINTDEHFLLYKALELNNLTLDDIEIISTTSQKASDLFIKGEVDGIFTYEPYLSKAAKEGNGKIIFTTKDIPGYMIDVLVGNKSKLEKRKKDYQNIVKAWYKAQDFIKTNPKEAFEIMSKREGMKVEDFEVFYNSFKFYTLEENKEILNSKLLYDKLEEMNDFLKLNNISNSQIKNIVNKDIVKGIK